MGSCFHLTFLLLEIVLLWLGYQEIKLQDDHRHGRGNQFCKSLKPGEEDPYWETEIQNMFPKLLPLMDRLMELRAKGMLDDPNPKGMYKRAQHPLGWGCLNGTLEIMDLNTDLKYGIFKDKKTYQVTMRLSKGSFDPDNMPKPTAIAVKIFGVQGNRTKMHEVAQSIKDVNQNTFDLITFSSPTLSLIAVPSELVPVHEHLIQSVF